MKKILVIGGGSWGTALSRLLIENGHKVYLWEYDEEIRNIISETGENSTFLPGIKLPEELNLVSDYCEVLVDHKRYGELTSLFQNCTAGLVFVSAFPNTKTYVKYSGVIAWETEVWMADNPSHMIHFNGSRFMGPY